ncbi:hypothetical protein MKX01_015394 [Papaver californicum]|nr:hypothetical protein MKX01_015394 [Papaver californicum]
MGKEESIEDGVVIPLLEPASFTSSSSIQTIGNIIVSVVGTGVLDLPFASKISGYLTGSIGVVIAALSTFYCMNLLVHCRDSIEKEEPGQVKTYGDIGQKAFGLPGGYLTETLVIISQCGGSVAYLIFIGQNLSSIFKHHNIPIFCQGLVFSCGIAVFYFKGFGMTLALERSMKDKMKFKWVLGYAFLGITFVYICFGLFGYLAYGDATLDIVTLNLPNDWSSTAVKIGLCLGLAFIFPIMVRPIHEIVEGKLEESMWFQKLNYSDKEEVFEKRERYGLYLCRAFQVIGQALIALCVPGFGVFVSLVGSTVSLDIIILFCGFCFAVYGTYNAIVGGSS